MVNITHKHFSLRKAIAVASVRVSQQQTIDAIQNRSVPKGDVFEFARAAGLLAVKKTSDVIPDCHPLPVEYTAITYAVDALTIHITVEVHAVYRTGVEVEAMHGAAVTALTMYDMLKPLDKEIEITGIRLRQKTGGKTGFAYPLLHNIRCAVVVCSDSVFTKKKQDSSGKLIIDKLKNMGVDTGHYEVVPDKAELITAVAKKLNAEEFDLIIFTGGTGVSPTDVTPEALLPLINRPVPGIMEAARSFGQDRTPYAMLSRGVSGYINDTLVLAFPGSARACAETIDALFPALLHSFAIKKGDAHEQS